MNFLDETVAVKFYLGCKEMKLQKLFAWFLVLVAPAAVWSSYLFASRLTRNFSLVTDYSALAVAVAIGIVGVYMLVRSDRSRVVATILYIVLTGAGMYLGMLATVCSAGDCP